jgi:hypothetical protein
LQARQRAKDIIDRAKDLTAEALENDQGEKPTPSEARDFESNLNTATQPEPTNTPEPAPDDPARDAYHEMMRTLFAAANSEGK